MDRKLPSFLRRRLLLFEARRALLAGEPEQALAQLVDPSLAGHPPAVELKADVLEVLGREALRAHGRGEPGEAGRLLALVAAEDPERGEVWARRLRLLQGDAGSTRRVSRRVRGLLARTLETMRGGASSRGGAPARAADGRRSAVTAAPPPAAATGPPVRVRLAVDDAGEYLAVCGGQAVLGHLRGGEVDLPLLADVDPRAARILRVETFHGGSEWRLEPLGARMPRLGDRELDPAGAPLADGDLVRLGPNVAFRFRLPDPSSGTALLELQGGIECEGAARVLLVGEGSAGRVRIGPHPARHVPLARLADDLVLEFTPPGLRVESRLAFRVSGWDSEVLERDGVRVVRLPCPPPVRIEVSLEEAAPGRAPWTISLRGLAPRPTRSGGPQ